MRTFIIALITSGLSLANANTGILEEGFDLLESGAFEEAAAVFAEYLEADPGNRTARICLGRAIGLSGDADSSILIFKELILEDPSGVEASINLAEAYLWDNKPVEAEELYAGLYAADSTNFPVCLGYANSLSMLRKYEAAQKLVDQALQLQHSEQALTSKKYILLGGHVKFRNEGRLVKAHQCLDQLEAMYPEDTDLFISRAVLFLVEKRYRAACHQYRQLLEEGSCSIEAYLGLSYCHMVMNNDRKALDYAENALVYVSQVDEAASLRTRLNHINMLGANRQFKEAHASVDSLIAENGPLPVLVTAKARMHLWAGELEEAASYSAIILESNSDGYELLMGAAEIYLARQQYSEANFILEKAVRIDSLRIEARDMISRICAGRKASIQVTSSVDHDNSGNKGLNSRIRYNSRAIGRTRLNGMAGYRMATDGTEGNWLKSYSLSAGMEWRPGYRFAFWAGGGLTWVQEEAARKMRLDWSAYTKLRLVSKRSHTMGIEIEHRQFDQNAVLIRSEVKISSLAVNYHNLFRNGTGVYTSVQSLYYSGGNYQFRTSASVYHNLHAYFRVGGNGAYSRFLKPDQTAYYSPQNYYSADGFLRMEIKNYAVRKWSLAAQFGSGIQRIDQDDIEWIYRWEASAGIRTKGRTVIEGSFMGSNAASGAFGRYAYYSVALRLNFSMNAHKRKNDEKSVVNGGSE